MNRYTPRYLQKWAKDDLKDIAPLVPIIVQTTDNTKTGQTIRNNIDQVGGTVSKTIDRSGKNLDTTVQNSGKNLDKTVTNVGSKVNETADRFGNTADKFGSLADQLRHYAGYMPWIGVGGLGGTLLGALIAPKHSITGSIVGGAGGALLGGLAKYLYEKHKLGKHASADCRRLKFRMLLK